MAHFVPPLAVFLAYAIYFIHAIDLQCQWPCAREEDVCQVISTTTGCIAQCLPLDHTQHRWVLVSPGSDPVFYTKSPSSLLPSAGEPCRPSPPASPHGKKQNHTLQRRDADSSADARTQQHSTAFNVVHVTAAALGIVCATLVGITAFIMCRRHHHHHRHRCVARTNPQAATSMDRFHQFAQDYCHEASDETRLITPLPEAHVDKKPSISPIMQQIHLHRQLIEQHQAQSPPPYRP